MVRPIAPASLDIRRLQYWWLAVAGLLLAGWLACFFRGYAFTGSFSGALWYNRGFLSTVEGEFMGLLLLLAVSCTAGSALWWVAVARLGYKLGRLLWYYVHMDFLHEFVVYNDGFSYCCTLLHLQWVGRFFFQDPWRMVTLPALYAYWLFLCLRILRTTARDLLPHPQH
jgi:hypothetical protein